jgi:hypothetical protein
MASVNWASGFTAVFQTTVPSGRPLPGKPFAGLPGVRYIRACAVTRRTSGSKCSRGSVS